MFTVGYHYLKLNVTVREAITKILPVSFKSFTLVKPYNEINQFMCLAILERRVKTHIA